MGYVTPEDIEEARKIDVLTYLKNYEPPPAEFFKLITEVRRVGVHLNQILKKANSIGLLDVPMIRDALDELRNTQAMLYQTVCNRRI